MVRTFGMVAAGVVFVVSGLFAVSAARTADSPMLPEVVVTAYGPEYAVPMAMPEVLVQADGPNQVVDDVQVSARGPQLVVGEVRVSAKRPASIGPLAEGKGPSVPGRSI